jgi:hypothetical protein
MWNLAFIIFINTPATEGTEVGQVKEIGMEPFKLF